MATTDTQKSQAPLRLNLSSANLAITPEQFDRLCLDNPDLKLELTTDLQLIVIPVNTTAEQAEVSTSHSVSSTHYDLPELAPEEIARRTTVVENFRKRNREAWESLTPEEKANHDEQFEHLYQLLEESRK